MADPTRGITCPDMRRVVREALAGGWVWVGWSGTTHAQIRWPETGVILRFGSTPSLASWKSLASDIQRESRVEVWRKGNRKRSRKADQVSGFSLAAASRESRRWHGSWGADVDRLHQERSDLIDRCRDLAAAGRREDLLKMPELWRRIAQIEDRIQHDFHQPVEAFDPTSLAN